MPAGLVVMVTRASHVSDRNTISVSENLGVLSTYNGPPYQRLIAKTRQLASFELTLRYWALSYNNCLICYLHVPVYSAWCQNCLETHERVMAIGHTHLTKMCHV